MGGPAARLRPRKATIPDPAVRAARLRERVPREIRPNFDLGGAAALKRTGWTTARQLRDLTGELEHLRLGGKSGEPRLTPRAMVARRHLTAQRLAPLLEEFPHLLAEFGVSSPYELAQLVLEMELALRRGVGTRTTTELAARGSTGTGGLFGDVVGRLLEVVAYAHKMIHKQLINDAETVLAKVIARTAPLTNLDGISVAPGTFSTPERATRIYTVVRDAQGRTIERNEFVDFIYLSRLTAKGAQPGELPEFVGLAILGDVKVPHQIEKGKAGEKFRDALPRLSTCTELELVIDGQLVPTTIPRHRLLHLPDDVKYSVASAAEGQKGPGYQRRFTRSDGTIVQFPVLGVDVKMTALYKLARLILRR